MHEKVGDGWRKVKDGILIFLAFLPMLLFGIVLAAVVLISATVVEGIIFSICWNATVTTMFGFSKMTIFQAVILSFGITALKSNYFERAKSEYEGFTEKLCKKSWPEGSVKIATVLLTTVFVLISIIFDVWVVMYAWNNILPQLLNIELVQINFWQALGFSFLCNLVIGVPERNNEKSKNDNKDRMNKAEKHEDAIHENAIHENAIHEDEIHENEKREDVMRENEKHEDAMHESEK